MIPYNKTSFTDPETNKKYTLSIHYDESPENPFTSWDCEPPLMYRYDRETIHYGTESIISELLDLITPRRLTLNKKELLDIIDADEDYIRENKYDSQTFADALTDELLGNEDNLDLVEALARIAKVPHERYDSRGYSQGDYADVLILLTPEWFTRTGANPKNAKTTLESTRKLFDAYAWGDVYGFTLTEHVPLYLADGTLSDTTDDDVIDSCWGFYGDDGLKSIGEYLPDFARPHLDALI